MAEPGSSQVEPAPGPSLLDVNTQASVANISSPASGVHLPPTLSAEGLKLNQDLQSRPVKTRSGNAFLSYDPAKDVTTIQDPTALRVLRDNVFQKIQSRLVAARVPTTPFVQSEMTWLLPGPHAKKEEWDALFEDPFLIDDAMLTKMLRLQDSARMPKTVVANTRIYYIRTFIFHIHELKTVLLEMKQRAYDYFEKLQAMEDSLDGLDDDQFVFVRYIGTALGRAYERHRKDLLTFSGGFVIEFLQISLQLFPDVVESARIQELPEAELDTVQDHSQSDIREQGLIAAFGAGCINVNSGGHERDEDVTDDDYEIFSSNIGYVLQVIQNRGTITQRVQPAPATVVRAIEEYAQSTQEYANTNPDITKTNTTPFTATLRDVVATQLVPSVLSAGYGIAVIIGFDIPFTTMRNPSKFFDQDIDTSNVFKNLLIQLGSWETSRQTRDPNVMAILNRPGSNTLAFMDLNPWPSVEAAAQPDAMRLCRSGLRAGNFCMAMPMGHDVTSVALGNFVGSTGLRSRYSDFIDHVALPHLTKITEPGETVKDSDWLLTFPMVHTGAVARRGGTVSYHRLTYLTLMIHYIAIYEFMKTSTPDLSKLDTCKAVQRTMESYLLPSTRLGKELEDVKEAVRESTRVLQRTTDHSVEGIRKRNEELFQRRRAAARLGFINFYETEAQVQRDRGQLVRRARLEWLGQAHDELFKEFQVSQRRTPAQDEWTKILEEDYMRLKHWAQGSHEMMMVLACGSVGPDAQLRSQAQNILLGDTRLLDGLRKKYNTLSSLESWLAEQDTGRLLYFLLDCDPVEDIAELLRVFLEPTDVPDPSGDVTYTVTLKETVMVRIEQFLGQVLLDDPDTATISERYFARMQKIDPRAYACYSRQQNQRIQLESIALNGQEDLSGSEIFVRSSGEDESTASFCFTFIDRQGATWQSPRLRVPSTCLPRNEQDLRLMIFEHAGISVTTWQRERLAVRPGTYATLTLASLRRNLSTTPAGQAVLKLWEEQTGTTVQAELDQPSLTIALHGSGVIPASYFEAFGFPIEYLGRGKGEILDRELLAESGLPIKPNHELWLWTQFFQEKFPGSAVIYCNHHHQSSVWKALISFLPHYIHHPYHSKLKGIAHQAQDGGISRKISTTKLAVVVKVLRAPVTVEHSSTGSVYKIGPQLFAGLLNSKDPKPVLVQDAQPDNIEATAIGPDTRSAAPDSRSIIPAPRNLPTTLSLVRAMPPRQAELIWMTFQHNFVPSEDPDDMPAWLRDERKPSRSMWDQIDSDEGWTTSSSESIQHVPASFAVQRAVTPLPYVVTRAATHPVNDPTL